MDVNNNLIAAVRDGRLEKVRELIDTYGLTYSKEWGNGYHLLDVALENKHEDVAELLLSKGSEVTSKSANNPCSTPLHFAASNGYMKVVAMILNKKAEIEAKDHYGRTPLVVAIENNATEAAELLLNHGADVNNIDDFGKNPLHYAVENRNHNIIITLLLKGSDVNAKTGNLSRSLHLVCGHSCNLKKITLLERRGGAYDKLKNGSTPLHLAVRKGYQEIITMLLANRACVNAKDEEGSAPLHVAVPRGDQEITAMLLTKGAHVNAINEYGSSPLHLAIRIGHQEIIKILLTHGADLNAKPKNGTTPLHVAVYHSNQNIIETLLKFGADINARDRYNQTVFYSAFLYSDLETVETLLKHRCGIDDLDFTAELVNFYMHYGNSKLDHKKRITKVQYHIVKMLAANLHVSEQHLGLIVDIIKYKMRGFLFECMEEISKMNNEKINESNISFYDILAETTSALANFMRNENIVRVLKLDNYETKFPIYSSMIKCNFQKGMYRKELLEQGYNIFYHFITNVSLECIEEIFSYLSNQDISIFIEALKPLSIGSPNVDS